MSAADQLFGNTQLNSV
jgi:hypothetical protein